MSRSAYIRSGVRLGPHGALDVSPLRWLVATLALILVAASAHGQIEQHPLKPPDRSSPRATLKTFLETGDALATFLAQEYVPHPSLTNAQRALSLGTIAVHCLDLGELSPAGRLKAGRAAAASLYEALSRIDLPPLVEIPDATQFKANGGKEVQRWVIPNTEIALVRVNSGPQTGEFLFDPETVARADEFYERVRELPKLRQVPLNDLSDYFEKSGGWMVPYVWIAALPPFLRDPIAGQAAWKWIGLVLIAVIIGLFLWTAYGLTQLGDERHRFARSLAQFALPVAVLVATPAAGYMILVQLNVTGNLGSSIQVGLAAVETLAAAWLSWRLAPLVAEAIIASPRIASESIDAHLIRVGARLLGIAGSMALLAVGGSRLGMPLYGIVAGLGVGGLAVALAAQPTIENLLGGLSLFADRPVRVGDLCKYGDGFGTVEAIGIRSTRMRGIDRTLTTIPNAVLAKLPIVNFTRRDQMLVQAVIGLRYETTTEQLRYVLVKLREMLLGHPRVNPVPARARFVGFGDSSLNIEVYAYVMTQDWAEFLGIREDILLRVMEIVDQGGASIAFPSHTLYVGRDRGPDEGKVLAAEADVRAWREEGTLPFPNFSSELADRIRGSGVYPPADTTAVPNPETVATKE
ncbi:MAG: mechanosensitive ion channel family protein [Betaproteobacteria bacterium]